MKAKDYFFTYDEIVVLRNAMAEYKHFIQPQSEEDTSEKRKRTTKLVAALYDQFKHDARLFRE